MKAVLTIRPDTAETIVTITVTPLDWANAPLDSWDRWLLDECSGPDASVADVLLGLQTLAFRLEQQVVRIALAEEAP